jgi:hypothetical protein
LERERKSSTEKWSASEEKEIAEVLKGEREQMRKKRKTETERGRRGIGTRRSAAESLTAP